MHSLKNYFLLLLTKLMRSPVAKRSSSLSAPRILIVSTTGFGDTLWATPAIRALKTTYPQSFIGVLTSPIGHAILSGNPHIDTILTLPYRYFKHLPKLLKKLKHLKFDVALIFHLSQRITLPLCALANIPEIIGTESINKGLDALLTTKFPRKPQHEILRRLQITTHLGVRSNDTKLEIYPESRDIEYIKTLLASYQSQGPIIILHPGAKDRFKQWAPSAFISVGSELIDSLNAKILVTGGADEKSITSTIAQALPNASDLAGTLSVKQLAALLAASDLVITNDTGPMHLAFAVHAKTIALFSPTDPALCGPLSLDNTKVLYQPKTCTPCLGKKCSDAFCMLQHSPHEVVKHALQLLNKVAC